MHATEPSCLCMWRSKLGASYVHSRLFTDRAISLPSVIATLSNEDLEWGCFPSTEISLWSSATEGGWIHTDLLYRNWSWADSTAKGWEPSFQLQGSHFWERTPNRKETENVKTSRILTCWIQKCEQTSGKSRRQQEEKWKIHILLFDGNKF